jgi:hypothetical protein
MSAIVFPVSSAPGAALQESAGRLINGYAVKTEQGAPSPMLWRRSAGLRLLFEIGGHAHCRGAILAGSTLLVVLDQRVYAVTHANGVFTATNLGALPGTDLVTIARNNAATPNIVAVCEAGAFNLFVGSAPTNFADGDLPSVNSVAGMNGYLIFTTGAGAIWATDLNAVTVQSDARTVAQMKPDALLRGVAFRGEFFAFGTESIEVYDDVGTNPFPLQYKSMVPRGLIGTHAVAGFEDGWANELIWVGEDGNVYLLDGYTPKPVGNDDVSRAVSAASNRAAIEACVYMDGKNPFFAVTSPGEWTWEYNVATAAWNERRSYGRADWRARRAIRAFDRWIAGDDTTGRFAAIDNAYAREHGGALVWRLESGANAQFPQRIVIPRADFNFTAALGAAPGEDPIETDPQVMIAWSLDGGYAWGDPVMRALGREGEAAKAVTVNRIGATKGKGVRFRLEISDPVHIGFMGGEMPGVAVRAP